MSDIADNGSFNASLGNINSQNFGPTATANQANMNANTALTQQQAQGAAISNQNARLQFALFKQGIDHLSDFSGQGGPSSSDNSGTATQSSAAPSRGAAQAPAQSNQSQSGTATAAPTPAATSARGGINDSTGVTSSSALPPSSVVRGNPDDDVDVGSSAADQARIQATTDERYNVDPSGTDAEKQAILQAHAQAAQMKLSGNKGLADAAEEKVTALKEVRDQNVISRKNAAALHASEEYDKLAAIDSAPKNKAFETMEAVYPESAASLLKKIGPDATPEELDEAARDTAAHYGAFLHRYTDRETVTGDDGATYDKKTGLRVDGVPIRGVTPERQADLLKQANNIVTTKNTDGSETTEPQYKLDGYANADRWVTDKVAQIRARNDTNNIVESAANHAAQYGHIIPGAPPVPGGSLYRGPQPGQQPAPGQQPQQPGAAPGVAPQPGQQPGQQPGAPQPGAAPQRPQPAPQPPPGDPAVLRQALNDQEFKLKTPPVVSGRGMSLADEETTKANVAARQTLLKDSSDLTSTSSQAKAYTDAALAVLNSPDKPPTGLSAQSQVALSRAAQAMGLSSGDWATRNQELVKYLGNLAVQNFKANFGAKPAAAEFDIQLNELNPKAAMTPDAIRDLLQSNSRIAQYGIDSGRRAGIYTSQGGDPNRFHVWNEQYFPRTDAQAAPTRPGQQASGPAAKPDSGGFVPGKRYTDKNGNSATYAGNGKWQ